MNVRKLVETEPRKQRTGRGAFPALCVLLFVIDLSIPSSRAEQARSLGSVHTWGMDSAGLIVFPEGIENEHITAVSAGGGFSLALTEAGRVLAWGGDHSIGNLYGLVDVPEGLSGVTIAAIAAAYSHSLVLSAEGQVFGWGMEGHDKLPVPGGLSNAGAVSSGNSHSLALTAGGLLVIWGEDNWGLQDDLPQDQGPFDMIASGGYHCLAVKRNGHVVAWGHDNYGQNTVPGSLADQPVKAIAGGLYHSLVVTEDGTLHGWGYDQYGEATWPSEWTDNGQVMDVAAGDQFSVVLMEDGTVRAWGYNHNDQTEVPAHLSDKNHPDFVPVIAIDAGWRHALALTMPQVAKPTISTESFGTQVNVRLSCATEGALIYYTLNGDEPTVEDGEPYFDTFAVIESATLKARAFKSPDYYPSAILVQDLVVERPEITVSDIDFGDVEVGATGTGELLIKNTGSMDAEITAIGSTIPAFQVEIDTLVSLEAGEEITLEITFSPTVVDYYQAILEVESNAVTQGESPRARGRGIPPPPEFSPSGGSIALGTKVVLSGDEEAELFFEFEGGEWIRYDEESGIQITEAGEVRLKAKAVVDGIESRHVETVYTVKTPVVRIEPAELLDFGEVEVDVRKSLAFLVYNDGEVDLLIDQLLFWDEDGRDVPEFRDIEDWSEPITVGPGEFFGFEINFVPSAPGEFVCEIRVESNAASGDRRLLATGIGYSIPQVAAPTFRPNPSEASFIGVAEIKLLTSTEGATVRYTLDGSDPSVESPAYDGEPIRVASVDSVVVKAQAFKDGWRASAVSTAVYEVSRSRPAWISGEVEVELVFVGRFGIEVDEDGTGTILGWAGEPAPTRVFAFEVEFSDDGKLFKVSDLVSHASSNPGTESVVASVEGHPVAADDPEPELLATIHSDGTITGEISGFGRLVGELGPVTGPAADLAGGYEMDLLYRDAGSCYAAIGPDGTVIMIMMTPDGVDACQGQLDSAGHVIMTTAESGAADLSVDASGGMALAMTPQGATAPIEFSGLGTGETGLNRLVNLSTRGFVGTQSQNLIAGFVINGTGKKPVLIRAMGPALAGDPFNVPGAIEDPRIELIPLGAAKMAENDNWSDVSDVQDLLDAMLVTGAFGGETGSKDAMILTELDPGQYTARISGVSDGTGVAIVEVYTVDDLDTPDARQVNISTRGFIGTGGSIMILGLKADGNVPRQFLIRAVGPTLGLDPFNLPGVLSDPVLTVVRGSDGTQVAANDDWDEGASGDAIHTTFSALGAFALPRGSKDAVVLITLPTTSSFTVKISGKGGETGVALAEVYEVP